MPFTTAVPAAGRRPYEFLVWVPAWLLPLGLAAAPAPLEQVQASATEWVKLRNETARLEAQWNTERGLLENTVKSLEERAALQADKRDKVKAGTAKDRDEIESLRSRNQATAADLETAAKRLETLSARLADFRAQLPPRLSAALEMSYRSLANPGLPIGERMNHVATILSRCAQFNQTVSSGEEVLAIDGGQPAKLYAVIYWGLAQGYAVDPSGGGAWVGAPGAQKWEWTARPEAARDISRLIAIQGGKADPDFIAVPARLNHLSAETSK